MQKIRDIMKKDILSVKRSTTLNQLLNLFKDFHTFPLVPVVDNKGVLVGVVYLRNLIEIFKPHRLDILKTIPLLDRHEENIFDLEIEPDMGNLIIVDDIMDKRFIKIKDSEAIDKAYQLMKLHSKERVAVVNGRDKLVGIIGMFDIVMEILRSKGIFG
jgi:CBS-domain-containing membrane protein